MLEAGNLKVIDMAASTVAARALSVVRGGDVVVLQVEAENGNQNIRLTAATAFALAADLMEVAMNLLEAPPRPAGKSARLSLVSDSQTR